MQHIYLPKISSSNINPSQTFSIGFNLNIPVGRIKMLIDSHAHLDMKDFDEDFHEVLKRARSRSITQIITVGVDISSSKRALEIAKRNDFIFSSIGYHPHHADEMEPDRIKELKGLAPEEKVVAWGEIGLDFYRLYSSPGKQVKVFKEQLEAAIGSDLPVIIHDRHAHREVFEILRKKSNDMLRGVIHCFSGDYDLAMAFIDLGFYISIPGNVTYKSAVQLQDVASRIPLERMLVETDAPFLAPVPKRGKRNEPDFIHYTVKKIARLRGVDEDVIARKTSENARRLFGLPDMKIGANSSREYEL